MDHGTRRQKIVETLLNELFQGQIKPRERLRVDHLAERHGVSVTPIREALVELAGLGVIELQANRGAVVRAFGPRQVREICQLRRILECEATRGACGRIAPFELATLKAELSKLAGARRTVKWSAETRRLDSQLHELITERCGNERLAYEIRRYSVLFRLLRDARHDKRTVRNNFAQMDENAEHLAIVEALIGGNTERAAAAMDYHVNQSAAALVQDLFANREIEADLAPSFLQTRNPTPIATI